MILRLLVVCGVIASTPAIAAEHLMVGIGVSEITPPLGYPMSGYFHERGATGTLDPLLAKAIVFRQGEEQAALVVGDVIGIDRMLADAVRSKVEETTGIPARHIIVAATHTHTGPNYRTDLARYMARNTAESDDSQATEYVPHLIDRLAEAVSKAHRNLKPVTVRAGAGHEENVSFNRRFILKDGTVRTWAKLSDPEVVKAAGPIDPEIGLVAFSASDDAQPFAAVVNFALYCDTVGGTQYSADYPGHIQRVLQRNLGSGFTSVFATGPCGDINHADPTGKPRRSAAEIGERIATSASAALAELEEATPSLGVARAVIDMPLQTYTDEDLAWAEDVIARDRKGEKFPTVVQAKAYKIRRLQRLREGKADLGRETDEVAPSADGPRDTLPAEVQALRLADDIALVALPGEVFVELGLAIKEKSPFEHTFVIELANDSPAYVPTKIAFEQGGYEANNSIYAPGGGEKLVETALLLLADLK